MRELKFRAWDKRYKRMSQPFGVGGDISCLVYFPEKNGKLDSVLIEVVACEKERFVIMQYTNLKDKNGKEIYEGDIVKISIPIDTSKNENIECVDLIASVVFDEEQGLFNIDEQSVNDETFELLHKKSSYFYACLATASSFLTAFPDIEVIGNIYQNPEILGGE